MARQAGPDNLKVAWERVKETLYKLYYNNRHNMIYWMARQGNHDLRPHRRRFFEIKDGHFLGGEERRFLGRLGLGRI
jgi:hypothetical protein